MRQIVAIRDANELDGGIAAEPPGGIENGRKDRFHVARGQVDDDIAVFALRHPHKERRDQLEIARVDELLPWIQNRKHQLDEAPEVDAREGCERLRLEQVDFDRAPSSAFRGDGNSGYAPI